MELLDSGDERVILGPSRPVIREPAATDVALSVDQELQMGREPVGREPSVGLRLLRNRV